jgi:2-polyprenyl-3-methyl-5-hydroxy-6-metoxy-1,4-benzoquinol methylase
LPDDPVLLSTIDRAAEKLHSKLRMFDVSSIGISDYNQRYFGGYLKRLHRNLRKYSFLMAWTLAYTSRPLDQFVLLEYGGGSGMLSLLGRELNLGVVIYNDIYDMSCQDAKTIGQAIGNEADYYVQGDIDDVIGFLKTNSFSVDGIVSWDVIEHVYEPENFLRKVGDLSRGAISVMMGSSANDLNPRIRRRLMSQQVQAEYHDRERKSGHKERDTVKAYLEVRKEIISQHAGELEPQEIDRLARVTRGLMSPYIEQCVDNYLATREIPAEISHPTNTCDPYTGNWYENLLDPYCLKDHLGQEGFETEVLNGYYGDPGRPRDLVLNALIRVAGKQGAKIAPFYALYGRRTSSEPATASQAKT